MSQFDDVLDKKAVALKYDEERDAAPVIVASGMGKIAEKIVEIAGENGIPVYEDDSLATMLTQLKLGSEIPPELYQAIVDIYVYFMRYAPGPEEAGAAKSEAQEESAEGTPEEAAPAK